MNIDISNLSPNLLWLILAVSTISIIIIIAKSRKKQKTKYVWVDSQPSQTQTPTPVHTVQVTNKPEIPKVHTKEHRLQLQTILHPDSESLNYKLYCKACEAYINPDGTPQTIKMQIPFMKFLPLVAMSQSSGIYSFGMWLSHALNNPTWINTQVIQIVASGTVVWVAANALLIAILRR